ncbi:MAG: patatin-like phospholipase family protein [bacterium]|nr:patatin-like phospholipase family protein [bacterium]
MTNELKYTCLFGGGAIRGLAYIGAIRAMEELGMAFDIIGGSSVGAVFATLLACGYKSYELENIYTKVNFELFKDIHFGFGKPFALSKGEIYEDWLNDLISKNSNIKHMKFSDLDKKLVIITTNLKNFATQEFSKFETPDFEIAKALKISSSMPGLMPPFKFNGADLADGDLQKASPMWKLSENINNSESRILEFRLEGRMHEDISTPLNFINTIYSCVTDVATTFVKETYGQNDRYDCLAINTGDVFFADLNLEKDARRKLIEYGYEQTMNYFKKILPDKKNQLEKIYSDINRYLKQAYKGLKTNNVEEVQWWFGDLFTLLCENKEFVDPYIYKEILDLKNTLTESSSRFMVFYTKFNDRKFLEEKMKKVIEIIENRVSDIKFFLHNNQ